MAIGGCGRAALAVVLRGVGRVISPGTGHCVSVFSLFFKELVRDAIMDRLVCFGVREWAYSPRGGVVCVW